MAIYQLNDPVDREVFRALAWTLYEAGEDVIEMKKPDMGKSWPQIKTAHVSLAYWGLKIGYTMEEQKYSFKHYVRSDLFEVALPDGQPRMLSMAEMTKEQMTKVIDAIFHEAMIHDGVYFPPLNEDPAERAKWANILLEVRKARTFTKAPNKYLEL